MSKLFDADYRQIHSEKGSGGFGRYLRAARINRGMSLGELAEEAGIHLGILMTLESGVMSPTDIDPSWVDSLADALGEDPYYFRLILGWHRRMQLEELEELKEKVRDEVLEDMRGILTQTCQAAMRPMLADMKQLSQEVKEGLAEVVHHKKEGA